MRNLLASFFKPESISAALAELVGTFFLTLAALLNGTPYAVGLTLAAFVYAIGAKGSTTSKLSLLKIKPP